jgi:hypothetical protein
MEKIQEWPKPKLVLYGGDDIARFRPGAGERSSVEHREERSKFGELHSKRPQFRRAKKFTMRTYLKRLVSAEGIDAAVV